jgi:hypothetical protein
MDYIFLFIETRNDDVYFFHCCGTLKRGWL